MRFVLGSDFHHEYENEALIPPVPECDMLLLAGDIHNGTQGLKWAETLTAETKTPTVYVPGNHEFYGWQKQELLRAYDQYNHDNVYLCGPGTVEHEDFVIIGSTLYSDLDLPDYTWHPPVAFEDKIGDFFVIKDWNVHMHRAFHKFNVKFIEDQLEKHKDKRCVVVTHFVPTTQCINKKWQGNALNPYFVNDLDDLIDKYKPEMWAFGHTHDSHDKIHTNGKTRLVCRPRGYPREKSKQFEWKVIDL